MRRGPISLLAGLALSLACNRTPPPPEPEAPEQLESDAVIAKSHSFFQAVDHDDAEAARPMLGLAFTKVENGRFTSSQLLLQDLRADFGSPPVQRTWTEEKVFSAPGTATFVGAATESFTRPDGGSGGSFDFWNTLVWTKGANGWTLALWQVERIPSAKEEWNDAYRLGTGFRHEPNQLLVAAVQGREPGRALDIAMGQGRNALYLASQGWKVTGVDISDEGLRQARAEAQKRSLELEAIEADTASYDYGTDRWDLVTLIYAGADPKDIERIKKAIKVGGMVVIEVFHKDGAAGTRSSGFATGELAQLFEGWGILRDEVTEDIADWGGPSKIKLVRFVALRRRDADAGAIAGPDDAAAPMPPPPPPASATAPPPPDAAAPAGDARAPSPPDAEAP